MGWKRLSSDFVEIFNESAKSTKLKSKIDPKVREIKRQVIADGKISDSDKVGEQIQYEKEVEHKLGDFEVSKEFNKFITTLCSGYSPKESGHWVKTALYGFLEKNFKIDKLSVDAQKIILAQVNRGPISEAISDTIERFKKEKFLMNPKNWENCGQHI